MLISIRDICGNETVGVKPSVGVFWGVSAAGSLFLINAKSELNASEPYGDFLTYAHGHYEVWEPLRAMSAERLARAGLPPLLSGREYEEFPRGRIVYHRPSSLFTIYADRRLQTEPVIVSIVRAFCLISERYEVRLDAHYR